VLKVSRIEDTGCQYRDDRYLPRVGREVGEKPGQLVGVVVDGVDVEVAEQVSEDALGDWRFSSM